MVVALTVLALIALSVSAAGLAVAGYFTLRHTMPDWQAALAVSGAFILIAVLCALAVVVKLRRATGTLKPTQAPPSPTYDRAAQFAGQDPLVHLISTMVQSPVVMSALVLGIAAGRATKRSRRD